MYALFNELMVGFNSADPIPYLCGFFLFLVLCGAFFRLLFVLMSRW